MIQFKRDTVDNIANHSTYVLEDGQPFYNKTDKLLYIGDGTTQLSNLEPLAGLNYLTMKDIWLSEYSSPDAETEFSPSLFNRQPVAGDVAFYFWKYSQQDNVYVVTATVTSADDAHTFVEVNNYFDITGTAGPTGLTCNNIYTQTTGAPSDGLLISPQVSDFSRSPNVGESCAIYYQYQDDVWLCMATIQSNNTEYCEAQIYTFTKINGEDGTDGKGILKSIKPLLYPNNAEQVTFTVNGPPMSGLDPSKIWTDGDNIYYSAGSSGMQFILDKNTLTWNSNAWSGISPDAQYIWTDGYDIYHSVSTTTYRLNRGTSTWTSVSYTSPYPIYGNYVWTDGENIYYSNGSTHLQFNRLTMTWSTKSWGGASFSGNLIWTDGNNIYSSNGSTSVVLDKATSTWSNMSWNITSYNVTASNIWTDGENIYLANGYNNYILDKSTMTWKTDNRWSEMATDADWKGSNIWTDGENIYFKNTFRIYTKSLSPKPVLGGKYGISKELADYESDQFTKFGFMRVLDNNIAQLYNVNSPSNTSNSRNYICFNGYGGEIEIYWDSDSHRSFKGPIIVIDVTPWGTNIVDYTGNTTSLGKGTDTGSILWAQTGSSRWLIFRNDS